MVWLNKIEYNNKLFQVLMDEKQNRIILEIKNDSNYYYMYPEFNDLLNITRKYFLINNIVYSDLNNKKKLKQSFIKISQNVLIAGVIVSILLCIPEEVKTYALEKSQNVYHSIVKILPNKISTHQELNEEFDTLSISKNVVHKAIDENNNLNEFKDIIHEYVDDVDKVNPNQNWWVFYQNIKRMKIAYNPKVENADGTFNPDTSEILILDTLEGESLKRVLRHELTHALSLINIKINNKNVKIEFINGFSGYGRSIMEILTGSFNSTISNYKDHAYAKYEKLFEPITKEIGITKFNNHLFDGDINDFINTCEPYFENISEYISYLDAIFYDKVNFISINQKNIDKDFLIKFRNMTIDYFANLQYKQLKDGTITYDDYINNKVFYINSLYSIINNIEENNNIEYITISDGYKYLDYIEKKLFDKETVDNIEKAYNDRNNLIISFAYNNTTESFRSIMIDIVNEKGNSNEYYYDFNNNKIDNFYFIVEDTNSNLKLRLINKKSPEYDKIDILTYQYINDDTNIILEVPVIDYINSIPKDKILGNDWSSSDYFTIVNSKFFNVTDIIEFNNRQNYNNKK